MATERFPEFDPVPVPESPERNHNVRNRMKSSSLRGDPRGDTNAPALSTMYDNDESASSSQASLKTPTTDTRTTRRSKRRRVKSLFKRWKTFSLKHTWVNPLAICIGVVAFYLTNPTPANPVHPALFLSYPLPKPAGASADAPTQYGKGARDFAFVAFYTVFLSFTREFIMQQLLRPLAKYYGITKAGKQGRFMEQAYTAVYFAVFGPLGLYVMSKTDLWYFNVDAMYVDSPYRQHEAIFKAYYLLQASYWAQQMLVMVLMLEKPRKDFKELIAHHIVTLALIWLSYRFHFTKMGLPVYITHDVSDFFLAISKTLNYIDSPIVIPWFLLFIGAWTYLRHYQNLRILASLLPLPSPFPDSVTAQLNGIYTNITARILTPIIKNLPPAVSAPLTHFFIAPWTPSRYATVGRYDLSWAEQQYKCWISQWITFGLLAALQALNIFWLFLVFRILYRMVRSRGQDARDDRSEDDDDDLEERKELLAKEDVQGEKKRV